MNERGVVSVVSIAIQKIYTCTHVATHVATG